MRPFLYVLMTAFILVLVSGCGGDKDKGMNRHRDMPRAAPPEDRK
jgi:hypothetical protein